MPGTRASVKNEKQYEGLRNKGCRSDEGGEGHRPRRSTEPTKVRGRVRSVCRRRKKWSNPSRSISAATRLSERGAEISSYGPSR